MDCGSGQGTAELAEAESIFVAGAERAVAGAPAATGSTGSEEAWSLLCEARDAIYHWPAAFPGFSAGLEVAEGTERWCGRLSARSSRDLEISHPPYPEHRWLHYHLEELISHREAPSVSRIRSRAGVELGDWDEVYGRRLLFVGDRMQSWYRVRDRKITQISRSYGGQSFVIHIDDHQECEGRFAARGYTVFYRDAGSNGFSKSETFLDLYGLIDGVYLPSSRRYTLHSADAHWTRELRFHHARLL